LTTSPTGRNPAVKKMGCARVPTRDGEVVLVVKAIQKNSGEGSCFYSSMQRGGGVVGADAPLLDAMREGQTFFRSIRVNGLIVEEHDFHLETLPANKVMIGDSYMAPVLVGMTSAAVDIPALPSVSISARVRCARLTVLGVFGREEGGGKGSLLVCA
jgi:hypothetical protein